MTTFSKPALQYLTQSAHASRRVREMLRQAEVDGHEVIGDEVITKTVREKEE